MMKLKDMNDAQLLAMIREGLSDNFIHAYDAVLREMDNEDMGGMTNEEYDRLFPPVEREAILRELDHQVMVWLNDTPLPLTSDVALSPATEAMDPTLILTPGQIDPEQLTSVDLAVGPDRVKIRLNTEERPATILDDLANGWQRIRDSLGEWLRQPIQYGYPLALNAGTVGLRTPSSSEDALPELLEIDHDEGQETTRLIVSVPGFCYQPRAEANDR